MDFYIFIIHIYVFFIEFIPADFSIKADCLSTIRKGVTLQMKRDQFFKGGIND